ncbi:MAG: hypothetical protein WC783_03110 [Candidatus Paceibacterota bacterium]|jgi:hypothetical protein
MQKLLNKQLLGWILIVIFILIIYYFFTIKQNQETEEVFCTQEALQCPDGSYVGRTGPKCEFAACPDQVSIAGTLRQDQNGFQLITSAPAGGMEVSYVLPLILQTDNITPQMVGKNVEVFGNFISGNTLNVDKIEELKNSDSSLGEVKVGQTMFINGVKITLNKIVGDSRCPIDVVCIQAGNIVANVTLQSNTDKETRDITSNKKIPFDSFQISIEQVLPQPKSTETIKPQDYIITFKVVPN